MLIITQIKFVHFISLAHQVKIRRGVLIKEALEKVGTLLQGKRLYLFPCLYLIDLYRS